MRLGLEILGQPEATTALSVSASFHFVIQNTWKVRKDAVYLLGQNTTCELKFFGLSFDFKLQNNT